MLCSLRVLQTDVAGDVRAGRDTRDRVTRGKLVLVIMSAAAAREARRKAILSRGTERLSKLATSARGDDSQFVRAGKPRIPSNSDLHYTCDM
jgi:hypothetical protein